MLCPVSIFLLLTWTGFSSVSTLPLLTDDGPVLAENATVTDKPLTNSTIDETIFPLNETTSSSSSMTPTMVPMVLITSSSEGTTELPTAIPHEREGCAYRPWSGTTSFSFTRGSFKRSMNDPKEPPCVDNSTK